MAVQKKTAKGKSATKKSINWTQVVIIGFCILIVVMCVLSFSNFSNFFSNSSSSTTTTGERITVNEGDDLTAVIMASYTGDNQTTSYVTVPITAGTVYDSSAIGDSLTDTENKYEVSATELTNMAKAVVGKTTYTQLECDGSGLTEDNTVTLTKSEFMEKYSATEEEFAQYKEGTVITVSGSVGYLTQTEDGNYTVASGLRGGVVTKADGESITYTTGSDTLYFYVMPAEDEEEDTGSETSTETTTE